MQSPLSRFLGTFVLALTLIGTSTNLKAQELYIGPDNVTNGVFSIYDYGSYMKSDDANVEFNLLLESTAKSFINFGIYNDMDSNQSGSKQGLYNYIAHRSSSSSQQISGVVNEMLNFSGGSVIGVENKVRGNGSGAKYGVKSEVEDATGLSPTNSMFGSYVRLESDQRPQMYGQYLEIENNNNDGSDNSYGTYVNISGTGTSPAYGVYVNATASTDYAAYFNGKVHVNGTFTHSSDRSLKENIHEISDALSIIDRLSPQAYNFRQNNRFGQDNELMHYGFVAQEVEEVLPSIVSDIIHPAIVQPGEPISTGQHMGPDGEPFMDGVSEPVLLHEEETLKAMRYMDLIAILTQGIKEQQLQISSLESALTTLQLDAAKSASAVNDATPQTDQALVQKYEGLQSKYDDLLDRHTRLEDKLTALDERLSNVQNCTDCFGANVRLETPDDIAKATRIYPNPATHQVTIQNQGLETFSVNIYSASGQLKSSTISQSNTLRLNVKDWVPGTYIFEVVDDKGAIIRSQQIIVQ